MTYKRVFMTKIKASLQAVIYANICELSQLNFRRVIKRILIICIRIKIVQKFWYKFLLWKSEMFCTVTLNQGASWSFKKASSSIIYCVLRADLHKKYITESTKIYKIRYSEWRRLQWLHLIFSLWYEVH
jgi:hypothetical protein